MPDIAQIIRGSAPKSVVKPGQECRIDGQVGTPLNSPVNPAAAVPQDIAAATAAAGTRPSGLDRLFSSIPLPRLNEPEEKCSGFADLPAQDYHLSLNSLAILFAKHMLDHFEQIQDPGQKLYKERVERAMKELYPLMATVIDILLEASHCAARHVLEERKQELTEEQAVIAYEDSLLRHVQDLSSRKWDHKDYIDGEDLNSRLLRRTTIALSTLTEEKRAQRTALGEVKPQLESAGVAV